MLKRFILYSVENAQVTYWVRFQLVRCALFLQYRRGLDDMLTLLVILLLIGSVAPQPTGTDVEVLPVTFFYNVELGLSEPSTILDVIRPKLKNLTSSLREACVSAERTPSLEYGNVAVNYTTRGQLTVDFEFTVAGDENGDCSKLIFSLTGSCSSGSAELYEPLSWFRVNQNGYVLQKCYPTMWGSWTDWSSCSGSCGVGKRSRFRHCFQTSSGNGCIESRPCLGDVIETEECTHNTPCGECSSVWANWGEWSPCSGACGEGCRSRSRGCNSLGNIPCEGDVIEVEDCSHDASCGCGKWRNWGLWSPCSGTCGEGCMARSRSCDGPEMGGRIMPCMGDVIQVQDCTHDIACGPCGTWMSWGQWSPCSATCGGGRRARTRHCGGIATLGESASCLGDIIAVDNCSHPKECSECSDLVIWSPWSTCSVKCGSGVQTRTRWPAISDQSPAPPNQTIECMKADCPTGGDMSPNHTMGCLTADCTTGGGMSPNHTMGCLTADCPTGGGDTCWHVGVSWFLIWAPRLVWTITWSPP